MSVGVRAFLASFIFLFLLSGCGGSNDDTIPPVITLLGENPSRIQQGETYSDAGATAIDDTDGSVEVTQSGAVDTSVIGSYTITYTSQDKEGNQSTATRTVNVVLQAALPPDTTPPLITILGDNPATILQGETYSDAGATAEDSRDGIISVSQSDTVNENLVGEYTVTYTASDEAGNLASVTRKVNVVLPPDNNLKITLKTSSEIAGYEIHLQFTDDTSSLNETALNNSFLGATGRTSTGLGPDIEDDAKMIKFGAFSFGSQDGVVGEFDVFTFVTKDRKGDISISRQSCIDKDAQNIDCIVTVEEQ